MELSEKRCELKSTGECHCQRCRFLARDECRLSGTREDRCEFFGRAWNVNVRGGVEDVNSVELL